jgi:glycosyltransferase involved in cell wall biosynthesis
MARFVDCWRALRAQTNSTPDLVLIGDPIDLPEPLQRLPGLHWRKDVSEAQLHGLYQAAECLWQPSFAEGFGLPVVEALYHGTPVAVAKGSALDEVTPSDSPRFNPHDPGQLAECMLQLGRAPQQRDHPARLEWAHRFGPHPYQARVDTLLGELTD